MAKCYSLNRAITIAMSNCIERGVLADVLLVNKAEVMGMLLTEYDEKKHMKAIRKEGYEDGLEEGMQKGIEKGISKGIEQKLEDLILKKYAKGKSPETIAEEVEEDLETVKVVLQKFDKSAKCN